jgi:hypothetical protein
MHTSRQARSVALSLYEKIQLVDRLDPFASLPYPQPPCDSAVRYKNGSIYFNFKLDTYVDISWNGSKVFSNYWEHQDLIPRIDFVTSYKCPELKEPFRLNICEDSVCLEDESVYENFLGMVDLCMAMYPEWKVPEIRLGHYEVPQGWF